MSTVSAFLSLLAPSSRRMEPHLAWVLWLDLSASRGSEHFSSNVCGWGQIWGWCNSSVDNLAITNHESDRMSEELTRWSPSSIGLKRSRTQFCQTLCSNVYRLIQAWDIAISSNINELSWSNPVKLFSRRMDKTHDKQNDGHIMLPNEVTIWVPWILLVELILSLLEELFSVYVPRKKIGNFQDKICLARYWIIGHGQNHLFSINFGVACSCRKSGKNQINWVCTNHCS